MKLNKQEERLSESVLTFEREAVKFLREGGDNTFLLGLLETAKYRSCVLADEIDEQGEKQE